MPLPVLSHSSDIGFKLQRSKFQYEIIDKNPIIHMFQTPTE